MKIYTVEATSELPEENVEIEAVILAYASSLEKARELVQEALEIEGLIDPPFWLTITEEEVGVLLGEHSYDIETYDHFGYLVDL